MDQDKEVETERSLAEEMADWELHAIRGLMTVAYGALKLLGRKRGGDEAVMEVLFTLEKARIHFIQGRELALISPEFRRRMAHMADPIIDEPLLDNDQLDAP